MRNVITVVRIITFNDLHGNLEPLNLLGVEASVVGNRTSRSWGPMCTTRTASRRYCRSASSSPAVSRFGVIGATLKDLPQVVTPEAIKGLKFGEEVQAIDRTAKLLDLFGTNARSSRVPRPRSRGR